MSHTPSQARPAPQLPAQMWAVTIPTPGGPEALRLTHRPLPRPGPGQVLIRHHAAGINGPDVMQRRGLYDPPPGASDIPGLEVSGEIVAVGEGVTSERLGQRVAALITGGGYAEYSVAESPLAVPLPPGLDAVQAAALLETAMTVWLNLFQRGGLRAGETVLIHGGTSGIGTMATQLARAFQAGRIITTVGSPAHAEASLALGADLAVTYKTQDFVNATLEATGGQGADVILDIIAGDYVARNFQAAAMDGRIVQVGLIGGPARELNLFPLLSKRLTLIGSTLRSRSLADKTALLQALQQQVWPLLATGQVQPQVYQSFTLDEVVQAHRLMDSGQHVGKIVLRMDGA